MIIQWKSSRYGKSRRVLAGTSIALIAYVEAYVTVTGFKAQIITDLSVFFNLEEFAETVSYTASGQAAIDVTAIIIRDTVFQEPYIRGPHTAHADLYIKKSEIAEPRFGDTFTADEEIWELDPSRGVFYEDNNVMVVGLERRLD